jgi:serine-type D-Ala-D-Ala carboxypeptidase (penicillin-binding protein 5/6)
MDRRIPSSLALLLVAFLLGAMVDTNAATRRRKSPTPAPAPPVRSIRQVQAADPVETAIDLKSAVPIIPPDLEELPLAAKGAIVLDECTGRVLYEKNADEAQYPASTTKMMTALLVIEEGDLDHIVEVTLEDSKVGESGLDIKPGQQFTRREALYGLMLKSANDVAHALGRDNAGSIEAFAEKMTRRARELGATNTHFMNPHGLHDVQHYTTPRDLAMIARAAMQQPLFRKIVGTQIATWNGGINGPRELRNHNRMLWMFPGCTGVKTGYTYPSQQVLACAALWESHEAISVIMHSDKPGIWNDTKLLLTYALEKVGQESEGGKATAANR